ncbi:unnamed protein product [Allacma fusca]|uniref:Peptidase M12B domain-containing protein n=1 Tax=Allacma fusca TaxID=39272 RepID=A0A8J2NTH6_9HEXA|nr:unnamed protein product [Allacma fusca]
MLRLHHVVFYVEPADNLQLYVPESRRRRRKRGAGNAILFEHIYRDDGEIPPDAENYDDSDSKKRRRKRQTKDQEQYSHANILHKDKDVIHSFKFKAGLTDHTIFDARRDDTYICNLCIWLQPNFAQKFSLGGSVQHGAAEIIDLIKFLNWIFRSLDFDQDGLPENIGFVISNLYINDHIRVTTTEEPEEHPGKTAEDGSSSKYMFSTNTNSITTRSALALATKHLGPVCKSSCATLAFVYHNMAPAVSTTNLRGLCTSKNIAVISGFMLSYKIAKYDVFRGLFHAVGHLFGAHHDDVTNTRCIARLRERFLNPFLMHPIQQLNVGVRPGSFRMSPCTKDHVTQFLASNGVDCLKQNQNDTFCGNGFVENGEECDCGSLWQCHLQEECCGESDTVKGCSIIDSYKTECLTPRECPPWEADAKRSVLIVLEPKHPSLIERIESKQTDSISFVF